MINLLTKFPENQKKDLFSLLYRSRNLLCVLLLLPSVEVVALSQPITAITTSTEAGDDSNYVGATDSQAYTWGTGNNLLLDSVTTTSGIITPAASVDSVVVRRADNATVTGERCAIFAERSPANNRDLIPALDCDLATVLTGNIINRGWLDVFSNERNNIERIDFTFSSGLIAPTTDPELENSGFLVTEKSGNNPMVMAVIKTVDGSGNPTSYGSLVKIWPSTSSESIRYGIVGSSIKPFSFLTDGATAAGQNTEPELLIGNPTSSESLGMVLVTLDDLGVSAGDTFFGFSYFSQDVYDATQTNNIASGITLNAHTTFRTDTSGGGAVGDADIYGGAGAYFSNTNQAPTTDDIISTSILNTAGATDIADLIGNDTDGTVVTGVITSLPSATAGILYLANGTTAVQLNQELSVAEMAGLTFDPTAGFTGIATFTYAAKDNDGLEDATPATFTIPITAAANVPPTTDDITSLSILNTEGVTDITDLVGSDTDGIVVAGVIKTLPLASAGILYMADGSTAVILDQELSVAETAGLKFDPTAGFIGNATFTYAAKDNDGLEDATPATFTIPITTGANVPPTTDDKTNAPLSNAAGATDMINLSGSDDNAVTLFVIKSLPTAAMGVLTLADGTTLVTVNQDLTLSQAAGLKFNPNTSFVGNAIFTYAAKDNDGVEDASPATVTIPVSAGVNNVSGSNPIPTLSEWAMIMLMMMLGFVGYRKSLERQY